MMFVIGVLVGLIPFAIVVWHHVALPEIYYDNVLDADFEGYMEDKEIVD